MRSLLPRLTCVLIGLSALCWTSCGSSRRATSSLQLTAYGLQEDGTPTVSGKLSAVSKILKWITALVCAVVVLILVLRFGKKGILW